MNEKPLTVNERRFLDTTASLQDAETMLLGAQVGKPAPSIFPQSSKGLHPERELPPFPPPGFYWAKLVHEEAWTVVEVTEWSSKVLGKGGRDVVSLGVDSGCWVVEWGPKLEPPAAP